MSVVAFLLLAQVSAPVTIMIEQPTVQSLTLPNYHYRCRVFEKTGKQGALEFKFQGQRGYVNAEKKLTKTESQISVQVDDIGILKGYAPWRNPKYPQYESWPLNLHKGKELLRLWFGDAAGDSKPPSKSEKYLVIMEGFLNDDGSSGSASKRDYPKYNTRWLGFCDETSTPQEPLSDEEVKALVQ
ncbi:hypothetical protein [Sphingosinicella microcystinivorans]|uniref:Uncharacterized protein n=1 Tax=Sphingosinicella microcystinivorans TaxID=335406 RepID=A0ABX9T394_SPHMI|nr:hypothetical protein [Sphingosinicella microcystinivorans]RKS91901.1 hypothetical protein DFR51_1475 [Sphingosinicella microcystinivorans]